MLIQDSVVEALTEIVGRFARKMDTTVELRADTRLDEDIGIDSPRMIDIMLDIEDRFVITIDDSGFQKIRTFGQLAEFVRQQRENN